MFSYVYVFLISWFRSIFSILFDFSRFYIDFWSTKVYWNNELNNRKLKASTLRKILKTWIEWTIYIELLVTHSFFWNQVFIKGRCTYSIEEMSHSIHRIFGSKMCSFCAKTQFIDCLFWKWSHSTTPSS